MRRWPARAKAPGRSQAKPWAPNRLRRRWWRAPTTTRRCPTPIGRRRPRGRGFPPRRRLRRNVRACAPGFENPYQFRPGPPPALTSAQYARDFNETKTLGGIKSTQRTAEQTAAVRFWTQPNLGVKRFQAAQQLASARKLDLSDSARMFALLSMGQANTFIVDWTRSFTDLLAAGDGDPEWRSGRQRCDRARPRLGARERNADASGISVAGGDPGGPLRGHHRFGT